MPGPFESNEAFLLGGSVYSPEVKAFPDEPLKIINILLCLFFPPLLVGSCF